MTEGDAVATILADLRDRKLLKYLFADDPDSRGAYGYVAEPIDLETQHEMVTNWVRMIQPTTPERAMVLEEAAFRRGVEQAALIADRYWSSNLNPASLPEAIRALSASPIEVEK